MKCSIRASHPKKNVTYFVLIKAQIELSWTVQDLFSIHTHVLRIGLESDLYIHMYTISQDLKEAFVWLFHQCSRSRGEVVSFLERNDQRIWVDR